MDSIGAPLHRNDRDTVLEPIVRERIGLRLAQAARHPVTLVVASAGFGKTTAVRQYLEGGTLSWIRYGVTFEGATLAGFVRGLVDVLLPVAPDLQTAFPNVFRSAPQANSAEWIAMSFREHLLAYEGIIHIDDLHLCCENAEVFDFIATLVERSPSGIRWIFANRSARLFPVASWAAYNRIGRIVDDQTLKFSEAECRACARQVLGESSERFADEAFSVTDGWPAAFMLALRTFGDSNSAAPAIFDQGSRKMIYEYLAEQVFARLTEEQRRFLLDICYYKSIDVELLSDDWDDAEALVQELRRHVPFLHVEATSIVSCDGLFSDFLQYQLALQGKQTVRTFLTKSARTLQSAGRLSEALSLYIRAGAPSEIVARLKHDGIALVESGRSDLVEQALAALEGHAEAHRATELLLLRALVASNAGDFARCDALFERAIEATTDEPERVRSLQRHALELIRRNRRRDQERLGVVIDALIGGIRGKALVTDEDALLLGTVATGCAILRRLPDAATYAQQTLRLAHRSDSGVTRATLYHQASFVAFSNGDARQAMDLSARAIDLAEKHGLHALAARSHSIRYSLSVGFAYEPDLALRELTAMIESSTKAGDAFLTATALAGSYALRTEFGESDHLSELRAQIAENPAYAEISSSAIASADAMRAAWSGRFRDALECVQGTVEAQISDARRGLRCAEVALYAATCGERDVAAQAVSAALAYMGSGSRERPEDRRRFATTHAYSALACIVMQSMARANTIIGAVEQEAREFGALERVIIKAARAAYLRVEAGESLEPVIALLREAKLGGVANLLRALPLPGNEAASSALAALTKTEIAVLREIVRGATNVKIAQGLGRSVNTVNVHVASILRKLECRTRQDAAELGRGQGL